MSVTLKEVLEKEKSILRNLYSLYLHDLSKFTSMIEIGADGFFEFEGLDKFWEVDGLSPYFILLDDNIIGFILLLERPFLQKESDFGINDIFILNKYKGNGMGRKAIKKIFCEKQGKYFVIELIENRPAISFWKKIYNDLNIQYEERRDIIDDEPCLIQTFKI
ncbi:GNAT family N-acetyltransferase [Halalkalibacterium halodurans]|uniref:BH1096 protein n=1 Tax=Halalkalibacterium halodurans (strain ATCC BAA-125 / DSM 18197 / FERM 7344 / JCM 9153 / C-125) TaxID=272558 RepID=Q9KDW5_HALH5|nr:GNAT family N-acetyltransferase [Halalkalibacterium halodurans]MDY7221629.1 GNAT family N-acetyltransferase [Halalkalibacterium halodurans]MDY7240905.1 GNAT family N-acetyltransferase [Halalkalibacterium halodurans]MED4079299.1 GNAT family N-acetyltransferase [Halalkalibacterium halodurans]MED4085370.1 GNAT family N-acetyltransferase [Halalkalibacterium halodurans]MED4104506.1 GNAT family N-acetyltransferase [Halalkalibacterium halodurans]